ncbi:MAG: cyanophycinase [Planctomycetales bacterium]|nr:cyanophycinase [Planctomycetales bacterium]
MPRTNSILVCPDSSTRIATTIDRGRTRFWLAWSLAFVVGVGLRWAILSPPDDDGFDWDDRLLALEKQSDSAEVPSLQPFLNPPEIQSPKIVGSLVVCGGGRLPDAVREEFLKLAGGEKAKLIVIPTASETAGALTEQAQHRRLWDAFHPATIDILHTRSRDTANSDKFVAPLRKATGVWIGGGRQSLIAAAYSGTRVERELHALLARGGVIGGTSAGAACQSRIMIVRGEVHDVPGLGLLPGTIIDQHFVVRSRKARLLAALDKHPQWLGVGIDEQSALVVQGANLRCVGDSSVTLCVTPTVAGEVRELVLKPGDTADLHEWRRKAGQR